MDVKCTFNIFFRLFSLQNSLFKYIFLWPKKYTEIWPTKYQNFTRKLKYNILEILAMLLANLWVK